LRYLLYLMPVLGSIAATLVILATALGSRTAPQEAAGYAMACALALVPYVFARAIDLGRNDAQAQRELQTAALEQMARRMIKDAV
jgi:flagellar biosynthesis protein FliP